jgi:hypothetical protein
MHARVDPDQGGDAVEWRALGLQLCFHAFHCLIVLSCSFFGEKSECFPWF